VPWQASSPTPSLHIDNNNKTKSATKKFSLDFFKPNAEADWAVQLSIYPEPEREIVVVDSPSVLETQIGVARKAVTGVVRDVHGRVHGAISEWIGIEHAVERACFHLPSHPYLTNNF